MTKEELIALKKRCSNRSKYVRFPLTDGEIRKQTEDEIFNACVSEYAAERVTDLAEEAVYSLSKDDVSFDSIRMLVSFSVFVNSEDIDMKTGKCVENARVLPDYVGVSFQNDEFSYAIAGEAKSLPFEDDSCFLTATFSSFVIELNKRGFELEGVNSFSDIKDSCLKGITPSAYSSVSFTSGKVFQKEIN